MHNESAKKARFEGELNRLVAGLLKEAYSHDDQMYWQTLHREPYGPVEPRIREAVYNGNAGILLFFADLYRYTKNRHYLNVAEKGCAYWLKKQVPQERAYYTLYTGWTGLLWLCMRLYELTGKEAYIREASHRVREWEHQLLNEVPLDDLISGHAGNALLLAQLYVYSRDDGNLRLLQALIEKLISGAKISRTGLKWGYKTNALDSFTGMSHGAAGIGHVLLQLYAVARDGGLLWMGEKAFRYEGEYYSRKLGSWVDLRIFPEHKQSSLLNEKGVSLYFERRAELNTWAHGLAGMGLARFAAYQCTGRTWLLREAERCVQGVIAQMDEPMGINFSLSTGYGSWVALLMEAHKIFPRRGYLERADELLLKAMDSRRKYGFYASAWFLDRQDPALMVGTTGIGSLLLQRLYQPQAPEVLLPKIRWEKQTDKGFNALVPDTVKLRLLRKYLPDTFALLDSIMPESMPRLGGLSFAKSEWKQSLDMVHQCIKALPSDSRKERLQRLFRWEYKVLKLATDPAITLYRESRSDQFMELAKQVDLWSDTRFEGYLFVRSKHVLLGEEQLVRQDADEGRRFKLTAFSSLLLAHMRRPISLDRIAQRMTAMIAGGDYSLVREKICLQLRVFVKQWFIELIRVEK